MQIILKQDVEGLGKKLDLVKVKDGYARNFLIPKGMAQAANRSNLKARENDLKILKQKDRRDEIRAQKIAERLGSLNLVFKAKAGEEGKIFGTITTSEIAEKASEKLGVEIDRRRIHLMEPIRMVGAYNVPIKLHPNVEASILIQVEAEGIKPVEKPTETQAAPAERPTEPEPAPAEAEEAKAPAESPTEPEPAPEENEPVEVKKYTAETVAVETETEGAKAPAESST